MKTCCLVVTFIIMALASMGSAKADVTTTSYAGWDAPGHDIDSFYSGNQSNCARTCAERSSCSAAVYNVVDGLCWLKSSAPSYSRASDGVLILKILTGRDGIDYPGGDYRSFITSSWQNCSRACFTDDRCEAYTYNKVDSTCWLKSEILDAAFDPQGIAGRK